MSSSASTFIGGLSIGAVGTLVVQQIAANPVPTGPAPPAGVMEVVNVLVLVLVVIVFYGAVVHGPRP